MHNEIKLTSFAHGSGCGCKIAPAVLEQIIKTDNRLTQYPALLVGNSSKDDAAVFDLGNGQCIISTTDFFMPIVNDAFEFGRIASANAISDVYAMGGNPLMAIAVLGWPVEKLPAELASQVLEGSRAVCAEAGIPLAGGHSIDSPEPFFGLAVTGMVQHDNLKKNNTAQEGDLLFITKPIGTGTLSNALKKGVIAEDHYSEFLKWLTTLNSIGAKFGAIEGIHAMTDVTGFGLIGHLVEMCEGSGLSAQINYANIPVMEGALQYLQQNMVPDATYRNWNGCSSKVKFEKGVNVMEAFKLLPDPQTNGGILVAVEPAAVDVVKKILRDSNLENFIQPIGQMTAPQEKTVIVA